MTWKVFSSEGISKDLGLLLVRLGVGLSIAVFDGFGKITAGPDHWASLGASMQHVGISVAPVFWGFLAAFAEFVGSCLLVLGFLFRPATFLLAFTMFIAVLTHLHMPPGNPNAGWSGASHALELLAVYLGLFFTGPGEYSLTPRKGR